MGMAQYLFFGELWSGFGIERETLNGFREVEFEGLVRLIPGHRGEDKLLVNQTRRPKHDET